MQKKKTKESFQPQQFTVQQAADYLGVHAATVRRWAYTRKLKGAKVGLRGDWRFAEPDLKNMSRPNTPPDHHDFTGFMQAPDVSWSGFTANTHLVRFYEEDSFLLESILKYIQTGDAAIVIATEEHRGYLEKATLYESVNSKRKYIFLDANETLSKFMVNGLPDPGLFDRAVGDVVSGLLKNYKNIRAYGEMVAVLWANGQKEAAIELEELWNNLQRKHLFTLYCAYPIRDIGGQDSVKAFSDVCSTHSQVLPSESYSQLNTLDKRLREIAELQQKAKTLEKELAKREEIEARKDDFISATSHELKTPLTSQKAFIQLLQQEVSKNNDRKYSHYITKINDQADKLIKLVSDLLDLSKIHGGRLLLNVSRFDINTCIKEAVEEMQAVTMQHTILIEGNVKVNIVADKEKITQVITNLLTNAVKYSPKAKRIIISIKKEAGSVTVAVKDFGIGIDKVDQERVFERFFRVINSNQKTYPGLGMGLYISNEIIKQHNGRMWVESAKGQGSTFGFSLPLK